MLINLLSRLNYVIRPMSFLFISGGLSKYLTTLIPLLRISIFCHFGSTSFVLPIRPKDGILEVSEYVYKRRGVGSQKN